MGTTPSLFRTILKGAGTFLVIIIAAVAIYALIFLRNTGPVAEVSPVPDPSGFLVLSAAGIVPDAPDTVAILPGIYAFADQTLAFLSVDPLLATPSETDTTYQHADSPNGNFTVFIGSPDDGSDDTPPISESPLQVYRADTSSAVTIDDAISILQRAEPITTDAMTFKQFPSVANTGEVLYMAREQGDFVAAYAAPAESWEIHRVQTDGTDAIVARGVHPKWVNDQTFVFVKNDGMYVHHIADGTEAKIAEAMVPMDARTSLDVSHDGTQIAWSGSEPSTFTIFNITDRETMTLEVQSRVEIPVVSVIFSPDAQFIATMSLVDGETPDIPDVRIDIYERSTMRAASESITLTDIDASMTHLTDWRP